MSVRYGVTYITVNRFDAQPVMPYGSGMKTERLEMRAKPEWLAAIDEWRRRQPTIPSRTEAVRQLVELGLRAAQQQPAEKAKG